MSLLFETGKTVKGADQSFHLHFFATLKNAGELKR